LKVIKICFKSKNVIKFKNKNLEQAKTNRRRRSLFKYKNSLSKDEYMPRLFIGKRKGNERKGNSDLLRRS